MNLKVVGLTVIITLAILAGVFAIAYFAIPQVAFAVNMMVQGGPPAGYGPGSGRGMMGGGGMMGGYYNNQPAASSSSPSSVASSVSSSAASVASSSASSNASAVAKSSVASSSANRLLIAVGTDGKTIPMDSNLPANTAVQTVGNTQVTIAITPFPPASFQKGNFEITLKDDKGQAITDAQVTLDLTMPSMRMP